MPSIVHLTDNKVHKSGETDLTDGQLKQIVEHRKVIISKFIDKGELWHCFFLTFESLKGKEKWKDGKPHYHYISSAFGLTREQVIGELKKKNYKLNNLPHIEMIDYRKR